MHHDGWRSLDCRYRREGNLRRFMKARAALCWRVASGDATWGAMSSSAELVCLMQALQALLRKLKVEHLVLHSLPSLRRMWTQGFGFAALTIAEAAAVEPRVVTLDSASAGLLKKPLLAPLTWVPS